MPDRCVVFGCSNLANLDKGISLHRIPFFNDERSEAKRRRKRWINFVCATRDKWVATKNSAVCSEHFTPESFSRKFSLLSESDIHFSPRLIRDDIGIVACPTIHAKTDRELTTRDVRMIKRKWMSRQKADELPAANVVSVVDLPSTSQDTDSQQFMKEAAPTNDEPLLDYQYDDLTTDDSNGPAVKKVAVECKNCVVLQKEIRHYKNLWLGAKHKLQLSRTELNSSKLNSTEIGR
ncbi:uncharacterized protein LOC114539590 [Dendronephthya gigantea]|uniref:uncharacterized protein LOC114539590 n=1 Tax=Dendronephthya gigantea TaxID=151771 RepID=UPI001069CAAA|nr:uncharacterized protein LOC114539590 [Dendronephthya gigantea]